MKELILVDKKQEIKKAEALVKSRYQLNPIALKLITSLISAIQISDINRKYQFSVKNFINLKNSKNKDTYKELRDACLEIMKNPITIENYDKNNKKRFLIINWASSCEYIEGEGIIEFQVDNKLIPYISSFKEKYLKYDLKNILPIKSAYSIRIYELLKDRFNEKSRQGRNAEVIFELDFLRDRLEITKGYSYKDIRVQILDKAKKDLQQYTDIKFEWEIASKIRKKVHSIKFKIYPNPKNIAEKIQLPVYLNSFIDFNNWLKKKYNGYYAKGGFFFFLNKKIAADNYKNRLYFFGVDKNNLVYAKTATEELFNLTKQEAEFILNAAYTTAKHGETYRSLLEENMDFLELYKNNTEEAKGMWGIIVTEIKEANQKESFIQPPLI